MMMMRHNGRVWGPTTLAAAGARGRGIHHGARLDPTPAIPPPPLHRTGTTTATTTGRHLRLVHRVTYTARQKKRNDKILHYMKQQQVATTTTVGSKRRRNNQNNDDTIVQLFYNERDDYSLTNLATTLRALLPRQHPALSTVLDAIASFLNEAAYSTTTTPWYDRTIDAVTYSNIIHALTKIPPRFRDRCDGAAIRILMHLHSSVVAHQFNSVADPQALSTVAWSLARLAEEEQETKRRPHHNYNNNNGTSTTTTYRDLLYNLVVTNLPHETVALLMQSGQPQAIANLLWACATLDVASPMLLDAVNEHGGAKLIASIDQTSNSSLATTHHQPTWIARTAWSCAKLRYAAPLFFAALDDRAAWFVYQTQLRDLADTVWASAKLGHTMPKLFAAMEERADSLIVTNRTVERQIVEIAQVAWACATIGHLSPSLFAEIDKKSDWLVLCARRSNGVDQVKTATLSLATICWACAKLGHPVPNLLEGVDKIGDWMVAHAKTRSITNTVWAFAALYRRQAATPDIAFHGESTATTATAAGGSTGGSVATPVTTTATAITGSMLCAAIDQRRGDIVARADAREVAAIAWSCATLGQSTPALFAAIDHHAERLVQNSDPRAIADTVWACATLGHPSHGLFAAVAERAEWLVQNGDAQAIAVTAFAFAKLGHAVPAALAETTVVHNGLVATKPSIIVNDSKKC